MFHDSGKGKPVRIAFERAVNEVCRDFTALAIDPLTGDLFLSSEHGRAPRLAQESAVVAQIHLEQTDKGIVGKLVRAFPVLGQNGETLKRVEGLSFDSSGNLYVLTENDGVMHRFDRR